MTADQLFMVHRRLGNQMPCRYYLDAKGDGSYSHACIKAYFPLNATDDRQLRKELLEYGMTHCSEWDDRFPFRSDYKDGGFLVRHYVALRDTDEPGGIRPDERGVKL